MDDNEIFYIKAAALFHDPPHKPWLIVKGVAHEPEAKAFADKVLKDTSLQDAIKKLNSKKVLEADRLAASIDRWILGQLIEDKMGAFPLKKVKLKNIFDPRFEISCAEPEKNKIDSVSEKLHEILEKIKDPSLAWHLLYSSYETLWIDKDLSAGPADTRNPTHTVFDHSYATAALLNWFIESDEPRGSLVMIDLAGVQSFVSKSRKLRDLWASSYLVSSLIWRTIWPFIEKFGPDVLIMPTCRSNPFYYHSLLRQLYKNYQNSLEEAKRVAKIASGYDGDRDIYPRFAIMPGTVTLILPNYNVLGNLLGRDFNGSEDLKKFIREKYIEVWNHLYDSIIKSSKGDNTKNADFYKTIGEKLDEWKKYGFNEVPPLPIRIVSVDVDEVRGKKIDINGQKLEVDEYLSYHFMMKYLHYKLSKEKLFKLSPEIELKITELTESDEKIGWPKRSERGFEYCTSCGKLPALIVMPSDEEYSSAFGKDTRLELFFSPGERLCPYCLIKRLVGIYPDQALGVIFEGKISTDKFDPSFPSTSDVASMEFKESLLEVLQEFSEKDVKKLDEIVKQIGDLVKKTPEYEPVPEWWLERSGLTKKVREIAMKAPQTKEILSIFIRMGAESSYLSERYRSQWIELVRKIGKEVPIGIYYSVIKSDADNMGKLISGRIEDITGIQILEYLGGLLEGTAKGTFEAMVKDEIGENIRITNLLKFIKNKKEIITSISFLTALSIYLMRSALRDIEIIEKHGGIVIYAGGDDLLALTPVSKALRVVYETRRSFGLGSEQATGFQKLKSFHIPSLISLGRSYSIYEAHYMYPMYSVISQATEFLDSLAKSVCWDNSQNPNLSLKKDTLVVTYSARGREQNALIPLSVERFSDIRMLASTIKMLYELIEDTEKNAFFTISLIYDLWGNKDIIEKLIQSDATIVTERFLVDLFKRNTVEKNKATYDKYVEHMMKVRGWRMSGSPKPLSFITEFISALRLIRSGLKGGLE